MNTPVSIEDDEDMTIGCIVQARMGSTRLPGKVLMEGIEGKTVLYYVINQLKYCKSFETNNVNPSFGSVFLKKIVFNFCFCLTYSIKITINLLTCLFR